jgi:hypothetical protein
VVQGITWSGLNFNNFFRFFQPILQTGETGLNKWSTHGEERPDPMECIHEKKNTQSFCLAVLYLLLSLPVFSVPRYYRDDGTTTDDDGVLEVTAASNTATPIFTHNFIIMLLVCFFFATVRAGHTGRIII